MDLLRKLVLACMVCTCNQTSALSADISHSLYNKIDVSDWDTRTYLTDPAWNRSTLATVSSLSARDSHVSNLDTYIKLFSIRNGNQANIHVIEPKFFDALYIRELKKIPNLNRGGVDLVKDILPITFEKKPLLKRRAVGDKLPAEALRWYEVESYPKSLRVLVDRNAQPLLKVKKRERGPYEVSWGDPVEDVELPGVVALPPAALGADPGINAPISARNQSCNHGEDFSYCFLPAVALHNGTRTTCTGILISPRWILTAAHCVCGGFRFSFVTLGKKVNFNQRSNSAVARVETIDDVEDGDGLHFVDREGRFCAAHLRDKNDLAAYVHRDVALVRLRGSIDPVSPRFRHALFADIGHESHLQRMKMLEVAGFGRRENDQLGGEKYKASISIDHAYCVDEPSVCHEGIEFAALESKRLSDSCNGDSGAGVYARLSGGGLALVGIVSRGITNECGPGGVYASIVDDTVRNWIKQIVPAARLLNGSEQINVNLLALKN